MILNFSDVAELKKVVAAKFSLRIHFHDGCGGQYFTVEEMTDELKSFLTEYFTERNVRFSEDGTHFSVEALRNVE